MRKICVTALLFFNVSVHAEELPGARLPADTTPGALIAAPTGIAVAPGGQVIPPPHFEPQSAPLSQSELRPRNPQPPVDPRTVFPQLVDKAAFDRYWTNPWLPDSERQRVWDMFKPRRIGDSEGNIWLYQPNAQPYIICYGGHECPAQVVPAPR